MLTLWYSMFGKASGSRALFGQELAQAVAPEQGGQQGLLQVGHVVRSAGSPPGQHQPDRRRTRQKAPPDE